MTFKRRSENKWVLSVFFFLLSSVALSLADASATLPRQVILTWQGSPQTTMTVTWRTNERVSQSEILFSAEENAPIEEYQKINGTSEVFDNTIPVPPVESTAWINSVELTGLQPATEYWAVIPHDTNPEKFKFCTAPETAKKVVCIAFSDTHVSPVSENPSSRRQMLFQKIAEENPDFTLGVGDFWYANMQRYSNARVDRIVDRWFDDWHAKMITAEGWRIPLIAAEGNHDGHSDGSPFFYKRIKLPPPQMYHVMQYGSLVTVITLNSGHSASIEGEQTQWLEQKLQEHQNSRWLIVQHHVSPYPAYRAYDRTIEKAIRENWVPLYEKYDVDLVISGHDHTYLRTYPLREGHVDDKSGIVYMISNGCGSVSGRKPDSGRWYIDETNLGLGYLRLTFSEDKDISTLSIVPVFPFDSSCSGTPYVLTKT